MRARVTREGAWWTVTYGDRFCGRMRSWRDAYRHAVCVTVLARRGEPTA